MHQQIKWHWNQIQIQWCITWKQAHGTYSTRPHDENPQELFYIIKLTQIHDAESAWRYSKEYRSCRQISFIHSWRCSRRWMDEGIQYNTEEWRWKKTIPMSFYNVILCPYHGTVLAIQIQVTYNAAGRAAKQVKWNCDPLKKWWRTSISAEYPNCVCNKYIIQYGTVRYGTYAMFSLPQLTGRGTVAHEQTAMRVERGGFRYG